MGKAWCRPWSRPWTPRAPVSCWARAIPATSPWPTCPGPVPPTGKISGWGAPAVRDARKVLHVNDLDHGLGRARDRPGRGRQKGQARHQDRGFRCRHGLAAKPITLLLQQEPLCRGPWLPWRPRAATWWPSSAATSSATATSTVPPRPGASPVPASSPWFTFHGPGLRIHAHVLGTGRPLRLCEPLHQRSLAARQLRKNFRGIMPLHEALTLSPQHLHRAPGPQGGHQQRHPACQDAGP